MLGIREPRLRDELARYRQEMVEKVERDSEELSS
jgi:phosphoribosylcarboxyaminoimidazole (NCAIR) mutase